MKLHFNVCLMVVWCLWVAPVLPRPSKGSPTNVGKLLPLQALGSEDRELSEYKGQNGGHKKREAGWIGIIVDKDGGVSRPILQGRLESAASRPQSIVSGVPNYSNHVDVVCGPNEMADHQGRCTKPEVTKSVFLFDGPKYDYIQTPQPLHKPKFLYDFVFVYAPEATEKPGIVIPSAQQKTVVFVLTKTPPLNRPIIQVPETPNHKPEVFYVNYNAADNPLLSGLYLQDVLHSPQTQQGVAIARGKGGATEQLNVEPYFQETKKLSTIADFGDNVQKGILVSPREKVKSEKDNLKNKPVFISVKRENSKNASHPSSTGDSSL